MASRVIFKIKSFISSGDERSRQMNINVLVSFLLRGGSILISLVLVPMTLMYLTNFEYGVWLTLSSVLHWIDYFDIGLGNGLRNKLAEAIAQNDMERGKIYVSTTFFLLTIFVLFFFFVYLIMSPFLDWNEILNTGDGFIPRLNEIVIWVLGLCCLNFIVKTIGTVHIAYQRPMVNNFISFLGSILSLVVIFVLTKTTESDLGKVAISFTGIPVLIYLLAYPYTFRIKYKDISPSVKSINLNYSKNLMGLGIRFFILQIVCLILFSTSNILISRLFSPEDVTPYNIGYRYINVVFMIFTIILTPLWTAITDAYIRKEYKWIQSSMQRMTHIWLLFLVLIISLICFSKPLISVWTQGKVIVSYPLLIALGVYVSSLMFNNIYASFANGVGRLRVQIVAAVFQGIIYIPLAMFLAKYLDVIGIAVALALVSLIPTIMLYVNYRRFIKEFLSEE